MLLKTSSIWVKYYLFRSIRILADTVANIIGLIYFSQKRYLPPITNEILLEPAISVSQKIRTGKLRCEDVLRVYIERIKSVQPHINALVSDRFENALKEAKDIDRKVQNELMGNAPIDGVSVLSLPLLGIPFTCKDAISVKDMSLTAGLYSRKGVTADEDAEVVVNLRNAGAIPIGITNVPEFLLWWDSYNNLYGRTNNPYDKSRISGGSSGGEAALLSAGGSIVGVGTDMGGSIRIPAYCCGVYGHKPTHDIIPINGLFPNVGHPDREKLLSFGPLCRYACDIKPMLSASAGANSDRFKFSEKVEIEKLKIYYTEGDSDPLRTPITEDISDAIKKVITHLDTKTSISSKKIVIKKMKHSFFIWLYSLGNTDAPPLSVELTQRKGRVNGWTELSKWFVGRSNYRFVTLLNVIIEGMIDLPVQRDTNEFKKLIANGEKVKSELCDLLGNDGVLIYPTQPETAPKHNGTFLKMVNCGYTAIFNVLQMPVTQVPLGLSRNGLPVGLQIVAAPYNDHLTIAIAEELEKQFGGWVPPCDIKC